MILDMRDKYSRSEAEQATIIVNARLGKFIAHDFEYSNAKIISFDSFKDTQVCSANKINEFLERREAFCPNLEIIDLSRACSPDASLESDEAKRFYRFVRTFKENTDIDIVATPELEKLFPILLQRDEEDDNHIEAYALPLKEEKYSALQAITKLQFAQAENTLSPELCRDILEHSNNNIVTKKIISAIDTQLSKETEQLDQYIPALAGCIAGRYVSPNNFDSIIDIIEKHISQDHITTEDINFCFGLQKESSQSEESYQRINNLIKRLIPHLPEEVRQELDAKVALKEKKQQEYLQKRQELQAKVDEYSDYLLLSDALKEDLSCENIRKLADTIFDNADKYPSLYTKILQKIHDNQNDFEIKAVSHWIEPVILRINSHGQNKTDIKLLNNLIRVVTNNQDIRHEYGHIFCQQLKNKNDSEFWFEKIKELLENRQSDHILLMNTYEDMEQAYKVHPELIPESLALFKETLNFPEISTGFNDHLQTLASIVGDTAQEHPEYTDTAIEILSDLFRIEKNLSDSSAKKYLRAKIIDAFEKLNQNELAQKTKRDLIIIHEKDQTIFANVIKELINDPQTDPELIEKAIELRLNSGLNVMIDDYDSPECLKWNLAVLQSKALQKVGHDAVSSCAEHMLNGVLKQFEYNPNYDFSKTFQAIYNAAPSWLQGLREKISNEKDLIILQNFDCIPPKVQKLYIGECTDKIDNLMTTDILKKFPEIATKKLMLEVCDYITNISSTYEKRCSLSGIEKWATILKEIDGYSSPVACVLALNEAMHIRQIISRPSQYWSSECACKHFSETGDDIKQFVKISTDIIDNVFEQVRSHNSSSLIKALKETKLYYGLGKNKRHLQDLMGEEATNAFLSGDESYKNLWDKYMVENSINAYLMFKKPYEILQGTPLDKKIEYLDKIKANTYTKNSRLDFPELLSSSVLHDYVFYCCSDKADKDVVKAVKTWCNTRIDNTTTEYDNSLLSTLIAIYNAEAKKGIEDKEIFSILYRARFSKNRHSIRQDMVRICGDNSFNAPQLKTLCQTSHLVNRWIILRKYIDKNK